MSAAHLEIKNPGSFQISPKLRTTLLAFAAIGLIVFGLGLSMDSKRAWSSFVLNHFYFLSLGIGGLFFAVIQWLTGAMWSAPVRRLSESFTAYLPFVVISLVILFLGIHDLYHWSHPETVMNDPILEGKSGFLNTGFFIIRNLAAVLIWIFFARWMVGNSLKQDQNGDYRYTATNKKFAPIFLIVFAITYTLSSFDQLMSLDPHWFSTMFGVYAFAGLFYSTLAALCLMAIFFRRNKMLEGIVTDDHLHDIGKFMFAFVVFWAYIAFSQFMLIWYANLPEETGYFLRRFDGGWLWISGLLLVGKFVIPFFALIRRDDKRNEKRLIIVAAWMLLMQWFDLIWVVQPEFFKAGPKIGWVEVGMFLGFLGVFGLLVSRFLSKNSIVAIKDPRMQEALHHHQ